MLEKIKIKELQTWLNGEEKYLLKFYQSQSKTNTENLNLFWSKQLTGSNVLVHYGTPQLIVDEIKKIIAPKIVYNIEEESTEQVVEEFIASNYWKDFVGDVITDLASVETAFGKISFEPEYDEKGEVLADESGTRFIERVNPLLVFPIMNRNRVEGYDIKEPITLNKVIKMDDESELQVEEVEAFEVERHQKGSIQYFLEDAEGELLDPNDFDNYSLPNEVTFTNKEYIAMFGVEIEKGALRPSVRHFDSQDEIWSQQRNETRKNKRINYIPETAVIKDGNGKNIGWNDMEYDYKITGVPKVTSEDGKMEMPKIQTVGSDIDPQKRYLTQLDSLNKQIVINAGLDNASFSPSIGESGESKKESYKRTLGTYDDYGDKICPFLTQVLNSYFNVVNALNTQTSTKVIKSVTLEDYVTPTLEDRIKTYGSIEAGNVMSIETRVKGVMPNDSSDDDIKSEIKRIQDEQGLADNFDLETEA